MDALTAHCQIIVFLDFISFDCLYKRGSDSDSFVHSIQQSFHVSLPFLVNLNNGPFGWVKRGEKIGEEKGNGLFSWGVNPNNYKI